MQHTFACGNPDISIQVESDAELSCQSWMVQTLLTSMILCNACHDADYIVACT